MNLSVWGKGKTIKRIINSIMEDNKDYDIEIEVYMKPFKGGKDNDKGG